MRVTTMPPVAAATAGAVCISSSAVLMKLASTASPSVVAFGRCAFALPVLGVLALREHRRGSGGCGGGGSAQMQRRSRWLARLAGVFLAADLILWSHTIAAIGAGLGTVVGNLEVLIIALLAWLVLGDMRLGPPWPALGWLVLLALTSQVIGWLLITVSMPRLAAGTIGALLLIQPAGSVALSYVILGERPSLLQLAGVALMLTGVVVAVTGRAPEAPYSRRRTRIIRHASAASTDTSPPKSP